MFHIGTLYVHASFFQRLLVFLTYLEGGGVVVSEIHADIEILISIYSL